MLWFDADEATMTDCILKRAATSGRNDDNIETLKKRFANFRDEQMPIINKFVDQGKCIKINALQDVDVVFNDVKTAMKL